MQSLMNMMKHYQTITHSRDILCYTFQKLDGKTIQYKYVIPTYNDTPKGTPIVEIKENSFVLTFVNQEQ
jgi:hypothetical protein